MDSVQLFFSAALALSLFFVVRHFAYPRPYPGIPYNEHAARRFLGDLPDIFQMVNTAQDPAKFAFLQCRKLGSPVVQLFFRPFTRPFIFVDDVREVEDIMATRTREFDRAPTTVGIFKPFVPHSSIIKQTTPEWRAQRRLWTDTMGSDFLRRVAAPRMGKSAVELVDLFRTKADIAGGRPFPVSEDFELATLDVIWAAVLGSDLGSVPDELDGLRKAAATVRQPPSLDDVAVMPAVPRSDMYRAAEYFNLSIEKTLTSPLPQWHHWLLRQMPQYKRHWAVKTRVMNDLIRAARRRFAALPVADLHESRDTCAMDMVLRREATALQKSHLSTTFIPPLEEETHDELFMFLIAGHETTATTLSWSSKFLTNNPDKQTKLRDALLAAFPKGKPTVEEILDADIPYMDATVEECTRLANIVPRLVRVATADTQVLGYHIPKGAHVMCSSYVAEEPLPVPEAIRSAKSQSSKSNVASVWDPRDMDRFVPERWLDGEGRFNPRAFPRLSFSAGPRACFGKKLAVQELRVMLAMLVLNFRFEPIPDNLNSPLGRQKALRSPKQAYVRLTAL